MKTVLQIPLYLALSATTALSENPRNSEGDVGYVRLPSAYSAPNGETSFTYFNSKSYTGQALRFQASDNLGLGVVFSDSELYDSDTRLDIKYQIFQESQYLPALAIGAHDLFGIGSQSGEYVVASKTFGDLEASLGVGWGALGGTQDAGSDRPAFDPHKFSTDYFFSGDASLFGGISYATPIRGLSLSADYLPQDDGDDFAYGIGYKPSSRWGVSVYARGEDEFGISISLLGNPYEPISAQDIGSPPIAVVPRALLGTDMSAQWAATPGIGKAMGTGLVDLVANEGGTLKASRIQAGMMELEVHPNSTLQTPKVIGRIMRSLAMSAPGSVETFRVSIVNNSGVVVSTTTVKRSEYEGILEHPNRNQLAWQIADIQGALPLHGDDVFRTENTQKGFKFSGGSASNLNFFNEDDAGFRPFASARYGFGNGLSLNARAIFELFEIDTDLPETDAAQRVRSDKALYRQDFFTLDRLTADYQLKMGRDIYANASVGLLETQYAGISGELLYAPAHSQFALGLDIARVTKRDPEETFGLLDYETTTGFGTIYWDTGFHGVEASLAYGRFLGEDWGGTAKLSRKFRNGWRVEGSLTASENFFDSQNTEDLIPTIGVSIPLQWAAPLTTRYTQNIKIGGSISDYGASLSHNQPLYNSVRDYDVTDYQLRWGGFWQ